MGSQPIKEVLPMQRFTDLKVWQRAQELAVAIYHLTRAFPREERYGLTAQLRRAAVSIAANIAEGSKRHRPGDYARMLNIAEGSVAEVECLLLLAREVVCASRESTTPLLSEVSEIASMLHGLRVKVEGDVSKLRAHS